MSLPVSPRQAALIACCIVIGGLPCHSTLAAPPGSPLAQASDVEFIVEYSGETLRLGDILYAQVSIENRSDHAVGVSDFHALVIRAETSTATQRAWGFGEFPGGATIVELAPGERLLVGVKALDLFSDDRYEDGTLGPFDDDLAGQNLTLRATCSTAMPHMYGDRDYRDFLLEDTEVIELGRPLIDRQEFDDAVAEALQSDDLDLLAMVLPTGQQSYLFTQVDDLRHYVGDARTYAAMIKVLAERLPESSSARRAASITLAASDFYSAETSTAEEKALSALQRLLTQCSRVEKAYWQSELLRAFDPSGPNVSQRKAIYLRKTIS